MLGVAVAVLLLSVGVAVLFWEAPSGEVRTYPVMIEIEPTPLAFFLDGQRFPYRLGEAVALAQGDYLLEVAAPGFEKLETAISVSPTEENFFSLELVPAQGVVGVSSEVPAAVWLDGAPVGRTPLLAVEREPGTYRLRADAGSDFLPIEREVAIEGRRKRQSISLDFQRSWAWVVVPADRRLRVIDGSGELVGMTGEPIKVYQRARPYQWTVSGGDAFQPVVLNLSVQAGVDQRLPPVVLEPRFATLEVLSDPPGLPILINRRLIGFSTPHRLEVPSGRALAVSLGDPRFEPWAQEVTLEPGQRLSVTAAPARRRASVQVASAPQGAEVYYSGVLLGLTPLTVELPVGEVEIQLRRLGYRDHSHRFEVKPGVTSAVSVELTR